MVSRIIKPYLHIALFILLFSPPPDVHTCAYPLPKKESVCLVLPFCGVALFSIKVRSVQLPFLLRAGTNLHRGEIRLC